MQSTQSVGIIGCGWLGFPLAENLLQADFHVKGSTTSSEKLNKLEDAGIDPHLIDFPGLVVEDSELFKVDFLVINIPPGRRNPGVRMDYPRAIRQVLKEVRKANRIRKIIFISSTSVYGSRHERINEETKPDPQSDSGLAILDAEQMIKNCGIPFVILRFGGLAGPGRHPGRFLSGKKGLTSGGQAINFLHLEDAIGVIRYFIMNENGDDEVYNIVSPQHPQKSVFYQKMCKDLGVVPPEFTQTPEVFLREISVEKFLRTSNYQFRYPDPMAFRF
jgi:nucleoside-diphosphate-sugar epimerase